MALGTLLHCGSGFRVGSVPATRLAVVFALSGYGPGNAWAVLFGYCAWLPCEGGQPASAWRADCLLSLWLLGLATCSGGCGLAWQTLGSPCYLLPFECAISDIFKGVVH